MPNQRCKASEWIFLPIFDHLLLDMVQSRSGDVGPGQHPFSCREAFMLLDCCSRSQLPSIFDQQLALPWYPSCLDMRFHKRHNMVVLLDLVQVFGRCGPPLGDIAEEEASIFVTPAAALAWQQHLHQQEGQQSQPPLQPEALPGLPPT